MGLAVTQDGPFQAGATVTSTVAFTRPADTTQYTATDVVGTSTTAAVNIILEFKNAAKLVGLGGIIQSAVLTDTAAAATKPDFVLFLFDTAPAPQADNAAFAPTNLELLKCIGAIAFPSGSFRVAGSGNGVIAAQAIGQAYTCNPNSTSLYGVLTANNAYTPASGEAFSIRLNCLQD